MILTLFLTTAILYNNLWPLIIIFIPSIVIIRMKSGQSVMITPFFVLIILFCEWLGRVLYAACVNWFVVNFNISTVLTTKYSHIREWRKVGSFYFISELYCGLFFLLFNTMLPKTGNVIDIREPNWRCVDIFLKY